MSEQTPLAETNVAESPEQVDQQLSFLANARHKVAEELKLTFTLPDPREHGIVATAKNAATKAIGIGGVYFGQAIYTAGEQGSIVRDPNQSQEAFDQARHIIEGVGVSTMALGALTIFLANRFRPQREELDKE